MSEATGTDRLIQRARVLLGPDRAGALREVDPGPTDPGITVDAHLAFEATDHPVTADVYVILDSEARGRAIGALTAAHPEHPGYKSFVAQNGGLVLLGQAQIANGEAGIYTDFRLAGIVGAFSGDE